MRSALGTRLRRVVLTTHDSRGLGTDQYATQLDPPAHWDVNGVPCPTQR